MPHFYRYRVEDDPAIVLSPRTSSILRDTPARESPAPSPAMVEASVTLFGQSASLLVPADHGKEHRQELAQMFLRLETGLKELEEENRQLREEVRRQKDLTERHEEEIGRLQVIKCRGLPCRLFDCNILFFPSCDRESPS